MMHTRRKREVCAWLCAVMIVYASTPLAGAQVVGGSEHGDDGITVSVGETSGASGNDDDCSSVSSGTAAGSSGNGGDKGIALGSPPTGGTAAAGASENGGERAGVAGVSEIGDGAAAAVGALASSGNGEDAVMAVSSGTAVASSGNTAEAAAISSLVGGGTAVAVSQNEGGIADAGGGAIGISTNSDEAARSAADVPPSGTITIVPFGVRGESRNEGGSGAPPASGAAGVSESGTDARVQGGAIGASQSGEDSAVAAGGGTAIASSEQGGDAITQSGVDSVSLGGGTAAGSSESGTDAITLTRGTATGSSESGGDSVGGMAGGVTGSSENGADSVIARASPPPFGFSENVAEFVVVKAPPQGGGSGQNGQSGGGDGNTSAPPAATSTPPTTSTSPPPVTTTSTPPGAVASPPPASATSTPPSGGGGPPAGGGTAPSSPLAQGPSVGVGWGGTVDWTAARTPAPAAGASGAVAVPLTPPVAGACPRVTAYAHINEPNDPLEVMKIQSFLRFHERALNVQVTGVFDIATFEAVMDFQQKYAADILAPWGATEPTGYVYITTRQKMNELQCGVKEPLTAGEAALIAAYRAERAREAAGVGGILPTAGEAPSGVTSTVTSTPTEVGSAPEEIRRRAGPGALLADTFLTASAAIGDFVKWLLSIIGMVLEWVLRTLARFFDWLADFFTILQKPPNMRTAQIAAGTYPVPT